MSNAFDKASLVMLPHAYEEGKVYSLKPTDRSGDFTFSRGADTATRVGEDGYIKKEHSNILEQSNNFDTSPWGVFGNPDLNSGQSDRSGGNTAWLLQNNGSDYLRQDLTFNVSTFSIYAKANTGNYIYLFADGVGGRYFDIYSGNLGAEVLSGLIESKIEPAENGYYRCSIVVPSLSRIRIYPSLSQGDTSSTANIYIQDAQVNQGLVATPYLETTTAPVFGGLTDNMPRLDYTDATCPSLLLEPERTNVWPYSEYLDFGVDSVSSVTITQNTTETLSPEGLYNATKLEGVGSWIFRENISSTGTGTWTISCWVKAVNASSNNTFRFSLGGNNLSSNLTATTEWQKFDFTFTNGGSSATGFMRDSSSNDADLYIYGVQVEEGSYPTSYIPTYGSAQTRVVDNCHLINGTSLPTAYPFTIYAEVPVVNGINAAVVTFSNTLRNDEYYALSYFNNGFAFVLRPNRTITDIVSSSTYGSGTHKVAVVVTDSSAELFVNGTSQAVTSTIEAFNSSINDVLIGQLRILSDLSSRNSVNQALIFPTALSEDEAKALTQN